ncbi:MAG: hypothetical protein QNJ34_22820 [Xenococcaceae cyanobacterium MO_188.B29]|nr:hypothetical protein [Xenococcaceae cyanobacterium MO_188.B29]
MNPIIVNAKASKLSLTGGVPGVLVFTNKVAYKVPKQLQRLMAGIAYIDQVYPALQGIISRINIANPAAKNPPPCCSHQCQN